MMNITRTFVVLFLMNYLPISFLWASDSNEYVVDRVIPGFSVLQFKSGFPLGYLKSSPEISIDPNLSVHETMLNEIDKNISESKQMEKTSDAIRSLEVIERHDEVKGQQEKFDKSRESVSFHRPTGLSDFKRFDQCVEELSPIIRQMLKEKNDLNTEFQNVIENSRYSSSFGICSKYLGQFSYFSLGLNEDFLIIRTLIKSQSEKDKQIILKVILKMSDPSSTSNEKKLARLFWMKWMPELYLTGKLASSIQGVIKFYNTELNNRVELSLNDPSDWKKFEEYLEK